MYQCTPYSSRFSDARRLLRDAKLFDTKLGQIDGAGNTGSYLIQLIEAKAVVVQRESEEKSREEKTTDASAKTEEEKPAEVKT
jgi:vacuolar protein sorting-associated protein 54